jgi:hypothetical protein
MKPSLCTSPGGTATGRAQHVRKRVRGAAYVEAIILIMFLLIIFAGVTYLGRYFEAQQHALAVARRCAWEYSWNACTTDPDCGKGGNHRDCLPAECKDVFTPDNDGNEEIQKNIDASRETAQNSNGNSSTDSGDDVDRKTKLRNDVNEKMGPFYAMIVGEAIDAKAKSAIERPASLPDAETSIQSSFYLPCNLRHQDPLPMAIDLFKDLLGGQLPP